MFARLLTLIALTVAFQSAHAQSNSAERLWPTSNQMKQLLHGKAWAGAFRFRVLRGLAWTSQAFPIETRYLPNENVAADPSYLFSKDISMATSREAWAIRTFDVKDDGSCGALPRKVIFDDTGDQQVYQLTGKIISTSCEKDAKTGQTINEVKDIPFVAKLSRDSQGLVFEIQANALPNIIQMNYTFRPVN